METRKYQISNYGDTTIEIGKEKYNVRNAKNLTDEEIDYVKDLLANKQYFRIDDFNELSTKVDIVPGGEYSLTQFVQTLRKVKRDIAKKEFFESNKTKYTEKELHALAFITSGEDYNKLYNYFQKNYSPFDIQVNELGEFVHQIVSNNIYDRMAATQYAVKEISFKVKVSYNSEPVTIKRKVVYNSTLSMRDIASFM